MKDQNISGVVVTYDPFAEPELEAVVTMTPAQLEIFATSSENDLASCAYNNVVRIGIDGDFVAPAFTRAASLLVRRHQSLRASFHPDTRTMCILKAVNPDVKLVDISHKDEQSKYLELGKLAQYEGRAPFDVVHGPLIRFHIVKTSEKEFSVFMVTHQLAVDHWSLDLLADEIAELYSAIIEDRPSGLPPAVPYLDYVRWLQSPATIERCKGNREYWRGILRQPREFISVAGSLEPPAVRGYEASRTERQVTAELSSSLAAKAASEKSTFFTFTLACYVALLCRLAGRGWIAVGIPGAGQLDFGENRLAASCINTLPLIVEADPEMTFQECLQLVRKELYLAQSHTPFSYSEVLQEIDNVEGAGRLPILTTMFNVDQEKHVLAMSGTEASYTIEERCAEKFEISMNFVSYGQGSMIQCYFNDQLFLSDDRNQFVEAYLTLLGKCVDNANVRICDVEINSGQLARAAGKDHSEESGLGQKFARAYPTEANKVFGAIPSEVFARWQAEAVTEEFDLSIKNRPGPDR